jgi:exodeoxyribonuclease VII large subunit
LGKRLAVAVGTLDAISPLATLQRGYAIVSDERDHVITTSTSVQIGNVIRARLAQGEIHARVESVRTGENKQLTLLDDDPSE